MRWSIMAAVAVLWAPAAFAQVRAVPVTPPVVMAPPAPIIVTPPRSTTDLLPPLSQQRPILAPSVQAQVVPPAPPVEPARDSGGGDAPCNWGDVRSIDGLNAHLDGTQLSLTVSATTFGPWSAWRLVPGELSAGEQNYRLRVCQPPSSSGEPERLTQMMTLPMEADVMRVRVNSATNSWWWSR